LVVTVLPAGLWADELLRVDVGDAVRFSAIRVEKQRAPAGRRCTGDGRPPSGPCDLRSPARAAPNRQTARLGRLASL